MKRTHILDLKSPIDIQTRLQVYIEAYKQKEIIQKEGLCYGLPIILWGLDGYYQKTPDGKQWSAGHTCTAFPELNTQIIIYIDKNRENKEKLRMQFLARSIKKLQEQLQVSK
jgi:hypothetical protein